MQLSYQFAAPDGCGTNTVADADGNRTSYSDSKDGAAPYTVTSCCDGADRLIGTMVANPPTADPVAGASLTPAAPGSTLAYDTHGMTTTLANQIEMRGKYRVISTFAIGAIFIPLGLTIFIHRAKVARHIANSQKKILGKALREPSPGNALGMGGVGIFTSLLGLGLVIDGAH